jgi:tetratricopeptide (TPR) repeat protein
VCSWISVRVSLSVLLSAALLSGQTAGIKAVPSSRGMAKSTPEKLTFRPPDPLNALAFEHFYNMEHERSIQEFREICERHPGDPDAINHLLTAVLFHELYRIGALNPGEFADDSFIRARHRPADRRTSSEIRSLVAKALAVEEKRLKQNPEDIGALYARGVTRAQFAIYTALIEHAWFSALRNAVAARHDHEKVLQLDRENLDARLIVGTHNYVVGSLPWAVKAASSVMGLGGNKAKGLEYLRQAASGTTEVSIDAKIVLVVFLRREARFEEALEFLQGLVPAYPHNVLFALEEGNLLRAQHREAEAEAVYRRVWQEGRAGHYGELHYEACAVSLGDLLRDQKDYSGAAAAYEQVGEVPRPDPEAAQRAALGAGEMYDLLRKRDLALKNYEAVVAIDSASSWAETARKRMKEPFRGT